MASQATLSKQANALVNLYLTNYAEKYGKQPTINRFREKWGFQSMVEDLGFERAKVVLEYYFNTGRVGHPVQYLLYNYDRLDTILREMKEDEIKREDLRRQTERRVEEWEARQSGNSGS